MKNKEFILFVIISFLWFSNSKVFSQKKGKYKTYRSINELTLDSPDTCYVNAFVTFIYICPPCPPPNQCKPCIENHFTIADSPTEVNRFIKVDDEKPENYSKSKKYTFLIRLIKTGDKEIRFAKLLKEKK